MHKPGAEGDGGDDGDGGDGGDGRIPEPGAGQCGDAPRDNISRKGETPPHSYPLKGAVMYIFNCMFQI